MSVADVSVFSATLAGAMLGGGVFLLIVALHGLTSSFSLRLPRGKLVAMWSTGRRGVLAVFVGMVVLAVTQWLVVALAASLLVVAARPLIGGAAGKRCTGGAAAERHGAARVAALASWTESLRDVIAGAAGLEHAIPASLPAAAPILQPSVSLLVDRVRTRTPLPAALRQFADDVADPSADLVAAALIQGAAVRGPGLRDLLGALAVSARHEVAMRQRVAATRRGVRRSVHIVIGVTVLAVSLLVFGNPGYVEPYRYPAGQVVLAGILGLFALGFGWLRRLAEFDAPSRFLAAGGGGAG